jgi:hypothetical protein
MVAAFQSAKKGVEVMEKKSDKAFMRWSRSALPRSARDSKQRTTFTSPVF